MSGWSATLECVIGGRVEAAIPLESGSVTEDATAPHRQTGSVTILADQIAPSDLAELLAVDTRCLLRPVVQGVAYGMFRPRPSDVPFGPETAYTVSLMDLSGEVALNTWTSTFTIASVTADAALKAIIEDRLPGVALTWNLEATTYEVDTVLGQSQSSPWPDVQRIAESAGMEAFFDGTTFVARTIPDPDTTGDSWAHNVSTLMAGARRIDTVGGFNQVVVTGELVDGTPVRSVYPADLGGVTPRPFPVNNVLVDTQVRADDVAVKTWRKVAGLRESVQFTTVDPDPTLRAGQVGTVVEPVSGTTGRWVLDSVVRPVGVDVDQTAVTRERVSL